MSTKPTLSIIIPVYNSAITLKTLHQELTQAMQGNAYELILVDDGSRDGSWNILLDLKKNDPEHIKIIKLSRNFGQHNAIACGVSFASGDFLMTMDDDLQHPPSEIPKLIKHQQETDDDVVYGQYIDKRHTYWRNAGSWFVRKTSNITTGNADYASSFRLMKREIAAKVFAHIQTGFLFIDEVIFWYTSRVSGVPVEHHVRREGASTYTRARLFRLYFDILINYSATPLRLMTRIGLLASFITMALGLRFIYNKLMHGALPGFTALIVTILFSTSILMLCLGIIGQYLYKLYQLQNRKPSYAIDQVL
ncbi:MAG: glycosyltransferase [Bacteroidia bacterium]